MRQRRGWRGGVVEMSRCIAAETSKLALPVVCQVRRYRVFTVPAPASCPSARGNLIKVIQRLVRGSIDALMSRKRPAIGSFFSGAQEDAQKIRGGDCLPFLDLSNRRFCIGPGEADKVQG